MTKKVFREVTKDDIQELLEIEKTFPNPRPKEAFLIEFEGKYNKTLGLEIDYALIGYIFYSEYIDEININHFAIHPDFRRKGYASELMKKLIAKLSNEQIIYLEVNTTNLPAINLYKKFGLYILNTRKNYYSKGQDAYIMQSNRKESI